MSSKTVPAGNRGRLEICVDMISVCQIPDGMKKTHIMYRANLSQKQLEKYLTILLESKLLRLQSHEKYGKSSYHATDKGTEFKKLIENAKELLGLK